MDLSKYCPNCGKQNEEGSRFCENCGERLSGLNHIDDNVGSNKGSNVDNVGKDNKNLLYGVVLVLIIAIAIAGSFAYISMSNNSNGSGSSDNGYIDTSSSNLASDNAGSSNSGAVTSSSIPLSEVYGLAVALDAKAQSQDLSTISSVQYKGVTFTKQQCLYIFSKAIDMKNRGIDGTITFGSYGNPDSPLRSYNSNSLTKSQYTDMAQRTAAWMDNHGKAPNYTGIYLAGSPDFGYDYLVAAFALVIIDSKNGPLVSIVSF